MTDPGVTDPAATNPSGSQGRDPSTRGVSRATLVGGVVAALAVGLIVGGAIGWKVEQHRVKDDVKNAKAEARSQVAQNVRPFGVVTAVDGNSVTIRLQTGGDRGSRTFRLTRDTTVDRGIAGRPSSIVEGATVLVRPENGGAQPVAAEIVVLPPSTTFGKR